MNKKVEKLGSGTEYSLRSMALWIGLFAAIGVGALLATRAATPANLDAITINANPTLKGTTGWNFANDPAIAAYDAGVTHLADGSGSMRFDSAGKQSDQVVSVTPGDALTISVWVKQNTWPRGNISVVIKSMDYQTTYSSTSVAPYKNGEWAEAGAFVTVPAGVQGLRFIVSRAGAQASTDPMWLDDLRVMKGVAFTNPPTAKTAFEGTQTRIDSLGNWQVFENGTWSDWFPFCLTLSQTVDGTLISDARYVSLVKQGFNCDIWGGHYAPYAERAKHFGMRSFFQFAQFVNKAGYDKGNVAELKKEIDSINASPAADYVAGYYWDNENSADEVLLAKTMTDVVKTYDKQGNTRRRPIFQLNGAYGSAGLWTDASGMPMSDFIGAYAYGNDGGAGGAPSGQLYLDSQPNQTQPGAYCQINDGVGDIFRSIFYRCLAQGSKAMSFWGDGPSDPKFPAPYVEKQAFWPDLPAITKEIKQLMPIIKANHRPSWSAEISGQNQITPVTVGVRDLNGAGYLIFSNDSRSPQSRTVTLKDLPYKIKEVRDYFTDKVIATPTNNTFDVTISQAGVGTGDMVVKLVSSGTSTDTTKPVVAITSPINGATVSGTSATLVAEATDNVAVTNVNFVLDSVPYTIDTTAPYTTTFYPSNLTPGPHTFSAVASDGAGNISEVSTVTLLFSGAPDTTLPTVAITSPITGTILGGDSTTITATAADNVGVSEVRFYLDSVYYSTDKDYPYTANFNPSIFSNGSHTLSAQSLDAANNISLPSKVTVTYASIPKDTTPPVVVIAAPLINTTIGATYIVSVNATDVVGVDGVDFYVDGGAVRYTDLTSPFSYSLDTTKFSNGKHTIMAYAYDAAKNVGNANVSVTITNAVTTPSPTPSPTTSPTPLPQPAKKCDFNADNLVTSADLFILLANINKTVSANTRGDCTGDGKVTNADLFALLGLYGK